ncbi:MAG: hypothetical protein D6696_13665 [Acidobacteria bacterium]|nr:MAG: hypothetical protein D6696_13665 [Acidobacteriota bacterium]
MRRRTQSPALIATSLTLVAAGLAGLLSYAAEQPAASAAPPEENAFGRRLVAKMGCAGCHAIADPAFEGLPKIGPDLRRIAAKTNAGWAYKWIESPRSLRPTTWMPHFFDQEEELEKVAEIRAMVAYLFARSEPAESYPDPPAGDAAKGEERFQTRGCTACHLRDEAARREDGYPEVFRYHGPNLVGLGSKVSAGWLFAWLKNPKHHAPDTKMPDLRLSDEEAADLTAYLMTSRDASYEGFEPPAASADEVRELLLRDLQAEGMSAADAAARVDALDPAEREIFLGELTIGRYGCYACHHVAGFEDRPPPASELTPAALADFSGHVGGDDAGTLPQPVYHLSERELAALRGRLSDLQAAPTDPRAQALVAGRKLATTYNCQGCHLVEGEGHAIKATIEDVGMLPPNLKSEGARVQDDWLTGYLRDPSTIRLRPWLTVEMPTFGFSADELDALLAYFAAIEPRAYAPLPPPGSPAAKDVAVGQEVFNLFQCARCHPAGADAAAALGLTAANLAPSLEIGHRRLRYEWIQHWILDPQAFQPGTKMPSFFIQNEPGSFQSPLAGVPLDSGMMAEPAARMLPHFESPEALAAYLQDGAAVAGAMRDYIWTLGSDGDGDE